METTLSPAINALKESILAVLTEMYESKDPVNCIFQFSDFKNIENVTNLLDVQVGLEYKVSAPDTASEDDTQLVETFNNGLESRIKNSVYTTAFELVVQQYLGDIIDAHKSGEEPTTTVGSNTVSPTSVQAYGKLCILLDICIELSSSDAGFKKIFHHLVSTILQTVFEVSTSQLEVFWYYIESRINRIKGGIIDKAVTADRIALLEICNPLTDKYYTKNPLGFVDSYKKDTFNDGIQARIRIVVNKLLSLEDNTGLNRYYSVSNRQLIEHSLVKRREPLIYDIIDCIRIIRDPYFYIKPNNLRRFRESAIVLTRVYDTLMEMESSYLKDTKRDMFVIPTPQTPEEIEYLTQKFSDKDYFPELYWISGFNKDPSTIDEQIVGDQKFLSNLIQQNRFREVILVQIFFIANFFSEISPGAKRQLLAGKPPRTKHIVDDSANEIVGKTFLNLKKQIINDLKKSDSTYAYILQLISIMEKHWWEWLIYNKDPVTNTPLFDSKSLSNDDLANVKSQFDGLFPWKEKKYFNVYVTPQLSRRMKGVRGLENVKVNKWDTEMADDNTKIWKTYRQKRRQNWMKFGELITEDMFEMEKMEEEEVGDIEMGEPENGEPENGEPENGEPENGEPENGETESGETENGENELAEKETTGGIETDEMNIDAQGESVGPTEPEPTGSVEPSDSVEPIGSKPTDSVEPTESEPTESKPTESEPTEPPTAQESVQP